MWIGLGLMPLLFIVLGVAWRDRKRPACGVADRNDAKECSTCPIAPPNDSIAAEPSVDWWAERRTVTGSKAPTGRRPTA